MAVGGSLKLGELYAVLKADDTDLERGLERGERRFQRFGVRAQEVADASEAAFGAAGGRAGTAFGNGLWRDAGGRLRDAAGRFASAGIQAGEAFSKGVSSGLSITAAQARQALSSVAGLIPMLLALGAAALFAGPALSILGGALGSLPALAGGGLYGIGALLIGFRGFGDAFKKTAAGGASAADSMHRVRVAERALADAHRESQRAQEALTRAREEAAERIDDLGRSLRGAKLDEEEAVADLAEAERNLRRVRATGNTRQIAEAERAYRRAQLQLETVQDRVGDLTKEQQTNAVQGVEGSDEVTAALDRQRRAAEQLEDAEHNLRQARRGSGGGGAADRIKLAPNAQRLVDEIKSFKDEWERLRLNTQQRLFEGADREFRLLAMSWLPTAERQLVGFAGTYNRLLHQFTRTSTRPEFIRDVEVGLDAARAMVERIGDALTGPFLTAWGKLSRASAPFLRALGEGVAGLLEDFSAWIDRLDKEGKLQSFFEDAGEYFLEFLDIVKSLASIGGSLFTIFFGKDGETGRAADSAWDGLILTLQDIQTWLNDPQNQQRVRDWMERLTGLIVNVQELAFWINNDVIPAVERWKDRWDALVDAITGKSVREKAKGMWDGVRAAFREAINWIISKWNALELQFPQASIPGLGKVGGGTFRTPDVPYLHSGGEAVRAGMVVAGDRGPEAMVMPAGAQAVPLTPGTRNGLIGGGNGTTRIEVTIRGTGLLAGVREFVAVNGGNVQAVLG